MPMFYCCKDANLLGSLPRTIVVTRGRGATNGTLHGNALHDPITSLHLELALFEDSPGPRIRLASADFAEARTH